MMKWSWIAFFKETWYIFIPIAIMTVFITIALYLIIPTERRDKNNNRRYSDYEEHS